MSKDSPTNTAELRRALQSKQKKIDVKELEDAASVDGCGPVKTFLKMMIT